MIAFKTARTIIRRWRESDLEDLLRIYGNKDLMRWVDDGQPISTPEAKRWLDVTKKNYDKRGYGMFAVEMRHSSEVIGFCGIVHPNEQKEPEIKYVYSQYYWGQGIATEVVKGLINYGITKHGLKHIIATTNPQNIASHRVLLKAGMQRGELRKERDGSDTQYFLWQY